MNSALTWQYAGRPSYRINASDYTACGFKKLPEAERSRLELLRGHMYYGLHTFLPQGAKYFTLLRSPIPRLLSYWENARMEARRNRLSEHWWLADARSLNLKEFIDKGRDVEINNGQVRRISSINPEFGKCTKEMLELAKERLEEDFLATGLSIRFEESLALLGMRIGWRRPLLYKTGKIGRHPDERNPGVDKAALDRLEELNVLDHKLYAFAARRFDVQINENKRAIDRLISRIQFINRLLLPIVDMSHRFFRQ